jgi:hypothetical protein
MGYWLMTILIIVGMAIVVYTTAGAFGAIVGMVFIGLLVYKNNKGEL